jgi:aspartate carbamoyltransferase catalytic subunit
MESTFKNITWPDYQKLPLEQRAPCCQKSGKAWHTLIAQQFDRPQLENLCALATRIRRIAKTKEGTLFLGSLLAHQRAMLYFTQPSTRTFLSFYAACQMLGMKTGEVRDTSTSSEVKGETPEDSIRTFSSYFNMIIMRTPQAGFAERMAWYLSNTERPVPIINAGSGPDQHPTQALLDIYTLNRSFETRGGIDGKQIVFCGDLKRGRTVRSLSWLLTNYKDVRQHFVAPPQFQIEPDILAMLDSKGVKYDISYDFDASLRIADAIYMTRIQDEWDQTPGESSRVDISKYWITAEHLKIIKPEAAILHPLPRRKEISTDIDSDPRAMYWRQMRNGMWIRAALIANTFDCNGEIESYATQNGIV